MDFTQLSPPNMEPWGSIETTCFGVKNPVADLETTLSFPALIALPLARASLCQLVFAIITAMGFGYTKEGIEVVCGNAPLWPSSLETGTNGLGIRISAGEWVRFVLDSRAGLLRHSGSDRDFLIVTNLRLICVVRDGEKLTQTVTPIAKITSVEVVELLQPLRPLILAGLTLAGAALTFLGMHTIGWSGVLPWIIGGVLLALSGLNASGYFFPEGASTLSFSLGTTQVSLPLRSFSSLIDGRYVANEVLNIEA